MENMIVSVTVGTVSQLSHFIKFVVSSIIDIKHPLIYIITIK